MTEQDIYIRIKKGGKETINHHRVWDRDLFLRLQIDQHSGPKTKPEDRAEVTLATKADYDKTHARSAKQ